jgi:hypothetical protein
VRERHTKKASAFRSVQFFFSVPLCSSCSKHANFRTSMEEFRKAFAVATALLLCYAVPVYGHGMMIHPVSRNFLAYLQGREWCPHCLNAGGEFAWLHSAAIAQCETNCLFQKNTIILSAIQTSAVRLAHSSQGQSRHMHHVLQQPTFLQSISAAQEVKSGLLPDQNVCCVCRVFSGVEWQPAWVACSFPWLLR